jgi:hypothetical protein
VIDPLERKDRRQREAMDIRRISFGLIFLWGTVATAWGQAPPSAVTCVNAASFEGHAVAGDSIVAAFGPALSSQTEVATGPSLPTSLAGTTVKVTGSDGFEQFAPLFFVSPKQVNYQMPPGVAMGAATITVTYAINSVTLAWDAPTTNEDGTPLTDLAGYRIHYGPSPGTYSQIVDVANVTRVTLQNLPPGIYYFAATAYDLSKNESRYSNEVSHPLDGTLLISAGMVQISPVAPGLFSANHDGEGVASAHVYRVKPDGSRGYEPVARFDSDQKRFVPTPIDLGPESDQVYLLLYGTGVRGLSSPAAAQVWIGGTEAQVTYAGAQGDFEGLDQVNVVLPRSLEGRGEVDVLLTVDGHVANPVTISVR